VFLIKFSCAYTEFFSCISLLVCINISQFNFHCILSHQSIYRERDAINSRAPGFHAVKRRVAALKTAADRLAKRKFNPALGITSNAVGSDGISLNFLKLLLPLIIDHYLHVFNHAISCSVFPTLWKNGIVRPVAKVASPSCPSDFCPITIVSVWFKGFERLSNG
jgi:hypothetical protein